LLEPDLAKFWVPKILSRDYEKSFKPAGGKRGVTIGMGMTEKQGGTDVRANTTRAEPAGDFYRITGHKWFMSAPMCDAFLVLAQAPGGLTCFFMPRFRPDGSVNALQFQRLKDKLGNRSNASSEVEFQDAYALRVGDEERSVLDRCFGSFACGEVDEILRAIDTNGFPAWADLCRNAPGRVAKTATDIEHERTGRIGSAPEELVAVTRQAMIQDMAKAAELLEQHGVPRFDRNRVVDVAHFGEIDDGRGGGLDVHRSIAFSRGADGGSCRGGSRGVSTARAPSNGGYLGRSAAAAMIGRPQSLTPRPGLERH
jgi:hypothetical protein